MFSQVSVSHSVHNRPHGYSVTAHPCYGAVDMHPTGMLIAFLFQFVHDRIHLNRKRNSKCVHQKRIQNQACFSLDAMISNFSVTTFLFQVNMNIKIVALQYL